MGRFIYLVMKDLNKEGHRVTLRDVAADFLETFGIFLKFLSFRNGLLENVNF